MPALSRGLGPWLREVTAVALRAHAQAALLAAVPLLLGDAVATLAGLTVCLFEECARQPGAVATETVTAAGAESPPAPASPLLR